MLDLQATAGNRAVTSLITAQRAADDLGEAKIDEGHSRAEFEKGAAAYEAKDYERARTHMLSAYLSATAAHQANLAFSLAQTCRQAGRFAEAIPYYEEYLGGGSGKRREDAMSGIQTCRSALAVASGEQVNRPGQGEDSRAFARAEFDKGAVAYEAKDYERSRTHMLSAYLSAPRDHQANVAFSLGQVCRQAGRHAEAIEWYQEYLVTGNGNRREDAMSGLQACRNQLAIASGEQVNRPEEGEDRKAFARAEFDKGAAAYAAKDYERARTHMLSAYLSAPRDHQANVAFSLGQVCRQAGRYSEALSWYQEYLGSGNGKRNGDAMKGMQACRDALAVAAGEPINRPEAHTAGDPTTKRATVREGSSGDDVIHLQRRLNSLGVGAPAAAKIAVDGRFDPRVFARVVILQEVLGLAVDGVVGPGTWTAMETTETLTTPAASGSAEPLPAGWRPTLRRGSAGTWVRRLQSTLNASGKIAGPSLKEDGLFGPRTRSRVILYQENSPLVPDGVVGPATWEELAKVAAEPATTPVPAMAGAPT